MDTSISDLFVTGKYIYSIYNDGKLYLTDINSSLNQEIHIPYEYGDLLRKHYPKIYVDRNDGIWVHTFQNSLLLYKKISRRNGKRLNCPPTANSSTGFVPLQKIPMEICGSSLATLVHLFINCNRVTLLNLHIIR